MKLLLISVLILLSACTYSINMVHTQGEASDVVDEEQTSSPDIKPSLSLPVSPL